MKDLYKIALKAHNDMLQIHIDTKTKDAIFHKQTEWFYENLFKIAHDIWEKNSDLWFILNETSVDDNKEKANKIIKELKNEVIKYMKNNDVTLWTEDLLGSIANKLENIEWDSRCFIK